MTMRVACCFHATRTVLIRANTPPASGGGVRGGKAAPNVFLGGVGGEAANTTQKLTCETQPHNITLGPDRLTHLIAPSVFGRIEHRIGVAEQHVKG
jgi:hypothetical protein